MRVKTIISILLLAAVMVTAGACAQPAPQEPVVVTVEVPGQTVVETVVVEVPAAEAPAAEEPAAPEEAAPLGPVTSQFSGWTYDLEKVMDNIETFKKWSVTEAETPIQVDIEWTDSGYGEFDTHVTTAYAAGNAFDVVYSSDHWLSKWAEAGWVVPIEDYYPEVLGYQADIAPFTWEAMKYKGKVYGLPYYTDVMYFFYNKAMLEKAGITSPPTTWAEVTEQSKLLMEQGITTQPFMVGLTAGSWFDEGFFAMIYSEGASLFDENLEPIFETNQGPMYDMIEYIAAAINDDGIMPLKVLEMTAVDVQEAFKAGDTAFAIVPGYMVREFNTPGISKVAGQAEVSMMPGSTHETDGYSRMYLMGSGALEDEVTQLASWQLIEFMGGKTTLNGVEDYHVAKRWAVENGLGFSIDSLWQDPAVDKAFSAMADTTTMQKQKNLARSKEGMAAPWFAEWISFVRTEVQNAFLRQSTTEQVLQSIKQQWLDLKAESQ